MFVQAIMKTPTYRPATPFTVARRTYPMATNTKPKMICYIISQGLNGVDILTEHLSLRLSET